MNASFAVLCLAASAMVAVAVSGLVQLALPGLDHLAKRLLPRQRVRLWLLVAALPAVVGCLAVGASMLPALGWGHDHCLAHGAHHPHLCPNHLGSAPGLVLFVVAGVFVARAAQVLAGFESGLRLSRNTSRSLSQAADQYEGAFVFPSAEPRAFVLGGLRPRVHLSQGLLQLGRGLVEPVLAHERVHARRRDLLWRALCPVLAWGHLPGTVAALRDRLAGAQELAADAEAAEALEGGRLRLAEAILSLAHRSPPRSTARDATAPPPAVGLSILDGNLTARVQALLEEGRPRPAWVTPLLTVCVVSLPGAMAAAHDAIHHGLETLLGALS